MTECADMNTRNAFAYLTGEKKLDYKVAASVALQGAEEGIVLLKNNKALPLSRGASVAFFGRMQKEYIHMGTGSGGRVHPTEKTDIFSSLVSLGLSLDKEVEAFYDAYVAEHPYVGRGQWSHPASQEEPLLEEAFASAAGARNETALYVITRTAGECRDLEEGRGEFALTETELANLRLLREKFSRLVILLNVCGVVEFAEIHSVNADAILLLWQGGMMGGLAAAKALMGDVNPCGKLPDTIAFTCKDYPARENFGAPDRNVYREDIYVGYRYFDTFAPEKILYPFGYGLSYTDFDVKVLSVSVDDGAAVLTVSVTNTGAVAGKEVVQCFVELPSGRLGKPTKVLAAFEKTRLLNPGETEELLLTFSYETIASYDDTVCAWLLEKGVYTVLVCGSVAGTFSLEEDLILSRHESALAPVTPFDRLVNKNGAPAYEPVPMRTINS